MVQTINFSLKTLAIAICVVSLTACQSESTSANKNSQVVASKSSQTDVKNQVTQVASATSSQANVQQTNVNSDTTTPVAPLPKELVTRYPTNTDMVKIESGSYRPLYLSKDSPIVQVRAFKLEDRKSVV